MKNHIFYVGLNDKDSKVQEIATDVAKEIIGDIVGDCTISDAIGVYTHEDGSIVKEKSIKVDMLFKTDEQIKEYYTRIKKELNQESIRLDIVDTNCMLV